MLVSDDGVALAGVGFDPCAVEDGDDAAIGTDKPGFLEWAEDLGDAGAADAEHEG